MHNNLIKVKALKDAHIALFEYKYIWGINRLEKALIKIDPNKNKTVLYQLGTLYDHLAMTSKGKTKKEAEEKANEIFKQLIKRDPHNPKGYWGIGRILLHNKNPKSIDWYLKAIEASPKSRSAKIQLATAYAWLGENRKALNLWHNDYKVYGPSFRSTYNMAQIYKAMGNNKKMKKFASCALRYWKKRPSDIRKSLGGQTWNRVLIDMLNKN